MARLTRSQRRARAHKRVRDALRNPGALAHDAVAFRSRQDARVTLDTNPNRAKRDASVANWSARTIAPHTIAQPTMALVVKTPLRTPTGRISRRGGAPEYASYVIGSRHPMPIVKES